MITIKNTNPYIDELETICHKISQLHENLRELNRKKQILETQLIASHYQNPNPTSEETISEIDNLLCRC